MNLLSTRLKMPQPRKKYIIREELFKKLRIYNEYKLIVVIGGAGSGKTTLISTFIKECSVRNAKWITLDESCNNVFIFWNYFLEAIKDYLGEEKQYFLSFYDANFQKDNFEQLLVMLVNQLDTSEDISVILDDSQYITDVFLLETIDFFMREASENVHLIILTRQEPLLYMGGLNMDGKLLIIGEQDLKISQEDSLLFLKTTLGLSQSNQSLLYMDSIAEGWIGGLQLIAAAAFGKSEKEIMNLRLDNRLITDYFSKEIFDILSGEEKDFLVKTSILSYFSQDICEKLIGNIDYNKIMSDLLQKNLLIINVDEENGIFRYHNILGEYLKQRFNELNSSIKKELHLKSALIFEELRDFDECLKHLFVIQDYVKAMNIILKMPQNASTFVYLSEIPLNRITENCDFAYQRFFYHYGNMDFDKCIEIYSLINPKMDENPNFKAFKCTNMMVEDSFNGSEIYILSIDEIDKLKLNDVTKAFILIKDATFLFMQGSRYDEALTFIDKAMKYPGVLNNPYIAFFSLSTKTQILEEIGSFNNCEVLYKKMESIILNNKCLTILAPSFYIGFTGVHLKRMDLKNASLCLKAAEGYKGSLSIDRGYKYNLAEFKFLIGETEEGIKLVKELLNMESYKNTIYIVPLLKYLFKFNELKGELLEHYLKDYSNADKSYININNKLLYAHILYQKGDIAAVQFIEDILKFTRKNKIKLKLVEAILFKIKMIYDKPSNNREIVNLFREAIYYGYEDRILLPFYLESETVFKVIKQFKIADLKDLNSTEKNFMKDILNIGKTDTKSCLSDRELEVLKELTTGIPNKEIAEHLCISIATVKSHIVSIYSKLEVNSRIAAIEEARHQGIL